MMNSEASDMFAIRPDHKGPKTVGILLIVFSIFLAFVAKADLDLANTEEVSDAYMEQILKLQISKGTMFRLNNIRLTTKKSTITTATKLEDFLSQ